MIAKKLYKIAVAAGGTKDTEHIITLCRIQAQNGAFSLSVDVDSRFGSLEYGPAGYQYHGREMKTPIVNPSAFGSDVLQKLEAEGFVAKLHHITLPSHKMTLSVSWA